MSQINEIKMAYDTAKNLEQKTLLYFIVCSYPAQYDDFNLRNIDILKKISVSYRISDHTKDNRFFWHPQWELRF